MVATPQCSNCFFSFIAPLDADDQVAAAGAPSQVPPVRYAGKRYCNRNAPLAQNTNAGAWLWPFVQDDFWCGEGADELTGQSYSVLVSGIPGTGGAGPGYLATSTTSLTIAASGSLAPVTQLNLAYTPGARVRLTSAGTGAWMEGIVTSYDGSGVLTFTADLSSGSGTHTDWDINLTGQQGAGIASRSSFTLAASASTTVLDAAVMATSAIVLTPTNAAAGGAIGGSVLPPSGGLYISARNAGVSFVVSTVLGAAAAGTETFEYAIIN